MRLHQLRRAQFYRPCGRYAVQDARVALDVGEELFNERFAASGLVQPGPATHAFVRRLKAMETVYQADERAKTLSDTLKPYFPLQRIWDTL